ncbi:MAG TPA: GAF domain-containing protein [Candidatus Binatus sp.]|nr:GAF domain-containing protein [Candidatus Binatus sp.]
MTRAPSVEPGEQRKAGPPHPEPPESPAADETPEPAAGGSELVQIRSELAAAWSALARRAETAAALADITAALTSLREPGAVLPRTVDEAVRLFGAFGASLGLLDPDGRVIRWAYDAGLDEQASRGLHALDIPIGAGVVGTAFARRTHVVTGDYRADRRFRHLRATDGWIRDSGVRSMVAMPLPGEPELLGILAIFSVERDAFGPDELATIKTLAHQAAIALGNARLIEELDRSRAALARRLDVEQSLREISGHLTTVRDPQELLRIVVDEAARLIDADAVALELIDPVAARTRWAYDAGIADSALHALIREGQATDRGLIGLALEEGAIVCTGSYLEDARIRHFAEGDEFVRRLGIQSMIAAPLMADGEPTGFLDLYSRRRDAFGPEEVQIVAAFGDQVSIALANAHLIEALARSRQDLQSSERRFRFLLENSPDIVFAIEPRGIFTFLSDSVERQTGWSAGQLVGRHFSRIVEPGSLDEAVARWEAIAADPSLLQTFRINLRSRDGGSLPVEINAVGMIENGRFAGSQGSARALGERERLEDDLRARAAALAASEERARLARELHDSVTQALFSMTLQTRAAELLLDTDPNAAGEKLAALRELQRDALAEMRSLVFELRPGGLAEQGLVHALRTHAAAIEGRVGLPVRFEARVPERAVRPDPEVEEAVYRVAQEALHNVVRHASARQVQLGLLQDRTRIRLEVEDDGQGFDPAVVPKGHLGLEGMRARVQRLGGRLDVQSRPGAGTRIVAELPIRGSRPSG